MKNLQNQDYAKRCIGYIPEDLITSIQLSQDINYQCNSRSVEAPSFSKHANIYTLVKRFIELEFLRATLAPLSEHYRNGVMLKFIGEEPRRYVIGI